MYVLQCISCASERKLFRMYDAIQIKNIIIIIKEAIRIRKTKEPMNRDEGNYELPDLYDDVIRQ